MNENINIEQYQILPLKSPEILISTDLLLNQDKTIIMNLMCVICSDLPYTPSQCEECDALFCTSCIKKWMINSSNKCCKCKQVFKEQKISRTLRNILEDSLIHCPNVVKGCEMIVKIQFLKKHLEECKYTIRNAKCLGCNRLIETTNLKFEINQHISSCQDILIQCQYCFLTDKRKTIMEDHLRRCIEKPFQCEDCKLSIIHGKEENHSRKECVSVIMRKNNKTIFELETKNIQDQVKMKELITKTKQDQVKIKILETIQKEDKEVIKVMQEIQKQDKKKIKELETIQKEMKEKIKFMENMRKQDKEKIKVIESTQIQYIEKIRVMEQYKKKTKNKLKKLKNKYNKIIRKNERIATYTS